MLNFLLPEVAGVAARPSHGRGPVTTAGIYNIRPWANSKTRNQMKIHFESHASPGQRVLPSACFDRRQGLLAPTLTAASWAILSLFPQISMAEPSSTPLSAPTIRPELAPNQALYDAADPKLRRAGALIQQALTAGDVRGEERIWTQIIDEFSGTQAPWADDVLGRALGNRGNSRSRQGKLHEALDDYSRSIELCPWSVDPVLNRGVALEALGRFPEALADYQAVLAVAPEDPAANNNLGNALAGMGDYEHAVEFYGKAARLSPQFSFAAANRAIALYQIGKDDAGAERDMRSLLRKYPNFSDVRAALAAALWNEGMQAAAEGEWARVDDPRYRDLVWIKAKRRWPPRLVQGLTALINVKDVTKDV